MSDRETRALANELTRLRRRLDRFETNQQSWARSVEEAALDFYDENDLLRLSVGRQDDGSYGIRYPEGEPPPQPSDPDVVTIGDGIVLVTWDGRFEERFSAGEFRNLRVHIDDGGADFIPTRSNQVGAIWARRGGSIVAVTDSDVDNPVYVKFVATNQAGQWSPESAAVLVDELDEDDLEEEQEELQWEENDGVTLTADHIAAGTVTIPLSFILEEEALTAYWGVLPQRPSAYSIDYDAQTITVTLSGRELVGDDIWVRYPYMQGDVADVRLDFEATGWKYLQTTLGDATDRSATGFDDSAWATGQGAFGAIVAGLPPWPNPNTAWSQQTRMWLRRTVAATPGQTLNFVLRVEQSAVVYWNGAEVYSGAGDSVELSFTVDGALTLSSNILAVRASDDDGVSAGMGGQSYFDLRIESA